MQKRYPELRRLRRQLLDVSRGHRRRSRGLTGPSSYGLYLQGTEASECIETGEL